MARLRIPQPIKIGLTYIALLTEEQYQELYSAFENMPLKIKRNYIFDDSGIQLSTISADEYAAIKEAVLPLYVGLLGIDVPESTYASDIADSLKEEKDGLEWVRSEEDFNRFTERLARLLSIDRVKLIAKTNDVITQNARTYTRARIISDIRPVFGENLENLPQVAVIVHLLKISYIKDDEGQEFVVALDTADIQQLIDTLERAKKKTEKLRSVASSASITIVDIT